MNAPIPPLVSLTEDLLRAADEGLVLTANRRLARETIVALDDYVMRQGRAGWRAPHVLSAAGWLQSMNAKAPLAVQRRVLSHGELAALIRHRWARAGAGHPRSAYGAFDICARWGIDALHPAFARTRTTRAFQTLVRDLDRDLAGAGAIAESALAAWALDHVRAGRIPVPHAITLMDFDMVERGLDALLEVCAQRGCRISALTSPPAGTARPSSSGAVAKAARVALATPELELAAAAQYARTVVSSSPTATVAVVIPDLESRYASVVRQFDAEFTPHGLDNPARRCFNVSGGVPLSTAPIVRAAIDLIQFAIERQPVATVERVLASPYLRLPVEGMRADLPALIDLNELMRAGPLRGRAVEVDAGLMASRSPLPGWIDVYVDLLDRAGWGTTGVRSGQHQAYTLARNTLSDIARWPAFRAPVTSRAALDHIVARLHDTRFAPESPRSRVQVLGYLETAGLRFSGLWVTGLTDRAWPRPVPANPCLPRELCRASGVPRMTDADELAFARDQVGRWRAAADEVVFSHPARDGDLTFRASALINALPDVPAAELLPARRGTTHPHLLSREIPLELDAEQHGLTGSSGPLAGGVRPLQDQAACPFKAWATHRLGLQPPRPAHSYPDAIDRGVLLHETLNAWYGQFGMPGGPEDRPAGAIEACARASVDRVFARLPASFRDTEATRVAALLASWLDLDDSRPPFDIVALETERQIVLDGLELTIRMDRIEAREGGLTVIDYKTGRDLPTLDAHTSDPQLPLYAVAMDDVRAIAYAQVYRDRIRIAGLRAPEVADVPTVTPVPDWTALRARWREVLGGLVGDLRRGYAAVLPAAATTCTTCHLHALCRIDDRPGSAT